MAWANAEASKRNGKTQVTKRYLKKNLEFSLFYLDYDFHINEDTLFLRKTGTDSCVLVVQS